VEEKKDNGQGGVLFHWEEKQHRIVIDGKLFTLVERIPSVAAPEDFPRYLGKAKQVGAMIMGGKRIDVSGEFPVPGADLREAIGNFEAAMRATMPALIEQAKRQALSQVIATPG